MPENRLISVKDAAAILGIHYNTACRLIKQGTFPVPVLLIGSRRKVSLDALSNLGRNNESNAATSLIISN